MKVFLVIFLRTVKEENNPVTPIVTVQGRKHFFPVSS